MGERVAETARSLGIESGSVQLITSAYALAMEPRRRRLEDDHHPAYLHPGRTALILMDDLGETDATVVAAASLVETEEERLSVSAARLPPVVGTEVALLVSIVPTPGAEDLAEKLVVAAPEVARVALAERLDQLRHAHLWEDMDRRRRAHREAEAVYMPVAERTHPTLARRYRWWCAMFKQHHMR
jgi:(p)ppGpp synthase/HD superfamily hydrolase